VCEDVETGSTSVEKEQYALGMSVGANRITSQIGTRMYNAGM
jgi:hypothetical protein